MELCPPLSKELARKRAQLAPEISGAFKTFSQRVFADGALPDLLQCRPAADGCGPARRGHRAEGRTE